MAQGLIRFPQKPVSIEGCKVDWLSEYLSLSIDNPTSVHIEPPFILYRLSYMYYTALGTITAIGIGLIVSYLSGSNKGKSLSKDLFSPVIYGILIKEEAVHEEIVIHQTSINRKSTNCS